MLYYGRDGMTWTVEIYTDARGNAPVSDFLDGLPRQHQGRLARTIDLLEQFGPQLGFPYTKHLRGKLWELRIRAGRGAHRIVYFAHLGQRFILLHGFLEKTRKTQRKDLELAERRMVDFLEREA